MNAATVPVLANIRAIARRELVARVTTRSYQVSTALLLAAAALVGLTPVVAGYLDRGSAVAVHVAAIDLRVDPVAIVDGLLNPPLEGDPPGKPRFVVSGVADLDDARRRVGDGVLAAVLDIDRAPTGALAFTVYTREAADGQAAVIARQAAAAIALADGLGGLDLGEGQIGRLLAPPTVVVRPPGLAEEAEGVAEVGRATHVAVVLGLQTFLLIAILAYGSWVAQGVVEEKSSRMMEVVLTAATPFELLAGKVLGVSAAAMAQFGGLLAVAAVALAAQGWIAAAVLPDGSATALPEGLAPATVLVFAACFVLGFLLYAVLFALAASFLARQEDVGQATMPLTLVACGAFIVAMYSTIGSLDVESPWVVAASWVPLVAPYLVVARFDAGTIGPLEGAAIGTLLVATILAAAWLAARIYAAGVLLRGDRPGLAAVWRALRAGS